jgi:site-specific recombinase XerD
MQILDSALAQRDTPNGVIRKVEKAPGVGGVRRPREREHLTAPEVETLIAAARKGRYPAGDYVFTSERGAPLSERSVQLMIDRFSDRAGLKHLNIHPHSLRHACGYYMAERGYELRLIQSYLGHREVRHTTRYVQISPRRFDGLWDD